MPVTPRERLARVLDGSRVPGAFSAQLSVPARDVRLTVAGAGPISFPVKAPQAKRMIASARPVRFGRGEQTLMDLSVRDTWEITPDQVTLTGLDWDAILTEVRDELGLPARARLRAEPHALLVYGKGQFFLPHQDSEKDDTMIGTLVVSLPSSHTGGELVIEHNGETVAYQASATEVSVAAFYADCRHEVKPVRTGYRVTFTCNLLLDSDPAGVVPAEPSAEAARYLAEHFTTRVSRWKGDDREPPNRLVYLLDHEYTQRGLSWDRLKGADAERAALLRAAAEDAGCEAVLALTEIKETWDTEPGRRGRGVDLTYIITSELTLSWWTGGARRGAHLAVCAGRAGVRIDAVGGPEAVRLRVHRVHGKLRQHDGPLVPASRGRRVAPGACLRRPGGGVAFVGADRAESPAGRRGPGQRAGRCGVRRAVLEGARS